MSSRGGIKRKTLIDSIKASAASQPVNKKFLADLQHAIEEHDLQTRRSGSNYYKPSSMTCKRQMYYQRTSAEQDPGRTGYEAIGMADTGTRRHEAIQDVLESMEQYNFPWKWWDVEEFLKTHRWPNGKCLDLKVAGKFGGETALKDEKLFVSFRCDGIIENLEEKTDDPFYLFEFKNQISFKASNKKGAIDVEHEAQVDTYGMELCLNKALVTYENRDVCSLSVPELYIITPEKAHKRVELLVEVEGYAERLIPPPCENKGPKLCKWCKYKQQCQKDG